MHSCQDFEENICFSNGDTNLHIHAVAQGRPEDNQVEFLQGPHWIVNPPKNLVLNNIRRFTMEHIGGSKWTKWSQPSTVVQRDPINRSYIVQTGAGVNYRRNRRHLQGVPAVAPYVVDVEPDDGLVETANTPAEPGVQVAPIAPLVKHTRCGRLVRPPVRFDQLPD